MVSRVLLEGITVSQGVNKLEKSLPAALRHGADDLCVFVPKEAMIDDPFLVGHLRRLHQRPNPSPAILS
jgi:hypothetical protein